MRVYIEKVGHVGLILIWKADGVGWDCLALVTTSMQGNLLQWFSRWTLEVSHRLYKQAFGLRKCLCSIG